MNIKAKLTSLALAGTLALSLTPSTSAAISPTTFHDVKPSDWYYSAVDHVVTHGYFNGVGDSTFAPSGSMSRAMAVTVLARMFGGDLSGYTGKTDFADVPAGAYYAKAVQWAVEQGIASGTSATTFSPDTYATREQISVFLYNAVKAYGDLGTFNSTVLNGFTDRGRVASWADTALQWATYNGIINGDNGQIKPKDSTTRAAFATISMNYDTKYQGSSTTPTPDPKPDPTPTPTPDPTPSEDEFVTSKEDEINNLLVAAWGSHAPTRDTGKLSQAARLIASGDIREVEPALKNVGFDKPLGTVQEDKYTTSRYDARSFLATTSNVGNAVDTLKKQDSLMNTNTFTEYGVGVYKINDIQFRVAIVTYDATPYIHTDGSQVIADWKAEQAAIPVNLSDFEKQVIDLTNQERAKAGLAPLTVTDDMQKAARIRAEELSQKQSHTRPDGRLSQSIYDDIGCSFIYHSSFGDAFSVTYSATAENIAWGAVKTPSEVVTGWMNSSGHRKNILGETLTHIGVGVYPRYVNGIQTGYYWTQCFIGI